MKPYEVGRAPGEETKQDEHLEWVEVSEENIQARGVAQLSQSGKEG